VFFGPIISLYLSEEEWMNRIAATARISALADIEESSRGSYLIIGDNVIIDSFVKIKFAGGRGNISIGESSVINSGCLIYSGNGVTIGKYVAVAGNCTFASANHEYRDGGRHIMQQGFMRSRGGIKIGDDVWIGANCVFTDGTDIGDGCVIAAGTIVRGVVPKYTVFGDNPGRVLKLR
jgi:virginiamycin A acetyltransferase